MEIEQIYGLQDYLNSLMMFKHLHSVGVDLEPLYNKCTLGNYDYAYYQNNTAFDNFHIIADYLFDIVECYLGHYDPDRNADKEYWAQLAHFEGDISDSLSVIVILDHHLQCPLYTGQIGASDYTGSVGELRKVGDDGVAIFFDEDYGALDWADVVVALSKTRDKSIREEKTNYEVAI